MYCSNSRRLTSFFVPTNKTKGQLGERSILPILLMPMLLYSAASLAVSVILRWMGTVRMLSIFPPELDQYGEPFSGSAAVLLALPPDPNRLDIYNDLDADLVNFFSCVKECTNVLMRELKFLPIQSRATFEYYRDFLMACGSTASAAVSSSANALPWDTSPTIMKRYRIHSAELRHR